MLDRSARIISYRSALREVGVLREFGNSGLAIRNPYSQLPEMETREMRLGMVAE